MDKISIRLALETDLDALSGLYLEFHEFHARHLPSHLRSLGNPSAQEQTDLRREIKRIIQGDDSAILVADHSGRLIGLVEVYLRKTDPHNTAVVPMVYTHMQSLYVVESFRRWGIGNQLVQAAEAWARHRHAAELRLDIWEFPAGPLSFYEKSGYHTFRRTLVKTL